MKKLIYIMNPMCGWCFGNSKSFEELYENYKNKFEIEVYIGAMWLNDDAPSGSQGLKDFVVNDAVRLKEITKQSPSQEFFNLAGDSSYRFDSFFPASAIIAVKKLDKTKYIKFMQMVQKRLFIDGVKLDAIEAYEDILKDLSINVEEFKKLWLSEVNTQELQAEFNQAKSLANSYPTLLIKDDSNTKVLSRGYFEYQDIVNKLS
ncbi:DsbA family protein [Sulfurospirillum arcachonense]|uniref:DsbA family protein n=1 Tax=Sulfurospirillum arcachonense TaxID=57666 RepID=UPI000468D688|nr:DsbA family protein [Sulfurospirillum arcachonense]